MPWLTTNQDSFYKTLTPAQSKLAFANEYDFDSPDVRPWIRCRFSISVKDQSLRPLT